MSAVFNAMRVGKIILNDKNGNNLVNRLMISRVTISKTKVLERVLLHSDVNVELR